LAIAVEDCLLRRPIEAVFYTGTITGSAMSADCAGSRFPTILTLCKLPEIPPDFK
jgi:hypothetical protein